MKTKTLLSISFYVLVLVSYAQVKNTKSVTVPVSLDHNRMLVDAEMQKKDGTWRKVRLWIDSGSPDFFISESLARDIGIDLSASEDTAFKSANLEIAEPPGLRVGGMELKLDEVRSVVKFQPYWLFSTMHSDGNLPSTLLRKYHIIFDYPNQQLTIAEHGSKIPQGKASPASIHPQTGIVQLDAKINGVSYSFALDMGASYSFISEGILENILTHQPGLTKMTGTLGCANMWGWWPANEQQFTVVRVPEFQWGNETFVNTGIVGVPDFSPAGPTLGEWYSRKTARPVDGFLGANLLKNYRIEIDYLNSLVYFEKGAETDAPEMDMVGLSVRQLPDNSYQVVGVAEKNGRPSVEGVEPGDIIIAIDGYLMKGQTMGNVVDKLRGTPGEKRALLLEREGRQFVVEAVVEHFL